LHQIGNGACHEYRSFENNSVVEKSIKNYKAFNAIRAGLKIVKHDGTVYTINRGF
jgi:hypothetical protein